MISVITATRNRHHELRRLLESLRAVAPERGGVLPLRGLFEAWLGKTLADPTRHVPALDAPAPAIDGGRAQG
jgi:hypothetical protein